MGRVLIGIALGGVVAYLLLPRPAAAATGRGGGAEPSVPPAARMARDFRRACRDLDPMMRQIESAMRDGSLSPAEGIALINAVRGLI